MKDNPGGKYSGRLFVPRKVAVEKRNDFGRIAHYVVGETIHEKPCTHKDYKEALEKCKAIKGPKDVIRFAKQYGYIQGGDGMAENEEIREQPSLYYRWSFTLNWLQALVDYLENPSTDEYVTFEKTELTDQQPAVLVLPSDKFLDQFPNADRSLLGGQYYNADWKYRWWWRFAIPWNGKVEPRYYRRYVEKTLALYFESPDYNVRLPDVHATVEVAFKKGKPCFNLFMRTLGEGMLNAFFDEWQTSKYSKCEKCGEVTKRKRQSKRFCSDACRKAFSRSNNL